MERIRTLYKKYKELLVYGLFGVLTTLINLLSFYGLSLMANRGENAYLYINAVAWLVAVVFAYITNKWFVFRSRRWSIKVISKEIPAFFGARIFSFLIEEIGLWAFVEFLGFQGVITTVWGMQITGELVAKLLLALIVIILNYFFSKFVIFRQKP